ELEDATSQARRIVTAECRRALAEDGSGAIVLGCAGMADFARALAQELGVPVIDGVAVAVKFVEALVGAGLGTSKKGDLAWPIAQRPCRAGPTAGRILSQGPSESRAGPPPARSVTRPAAAADLTRTHGGSAAGVAERDQIGSLV